MLEVGLGGRLDAVNALDADCAMLTSVGIDHVDYLGADRESIGREKAGIFRPYRPAVIAEPDPPHSVRGAVGNKLLPRTGLRLRARRGASGRYWGPRGKRAGLAHPALRGGIQLRNAAAALCALDALELPVAMQEVRRGLAEVTLPARFQVLPGRPQVILDVAHNVEAARNARRESRRVRLRAGNHRGVRHAARQGHSPACCARLAPRVTRWHLASLPGPRAAVGGRSGATSPHRRAAHAGEAFDSPSAALAAALERAGEGDKIVVFGSFLTVGEAMAWLKNNNKTSKR